LLLPDTQLLHLAKKTPLSACKAHFPFCNKNGVNLAVVILGVLEIITAELGILELLKQLRHLDIYLPLSD
jgi:hypothetical protein